jgi:hypothetical protein
MMNAHPLRLAAALLLAALPACHHSSEPAVDAPTPARTVLRVINRNFADFTIYLVRYGDRVRLGLATGNSTSTFEFPSQFVQSGAVRFEANPVGGTSPGRTEQLSVRPGDVVTVQIQP